MSINKHYPPLSDLIDATELPGNFETLENTLNEGIDILLSKVLYTDYQVQVLKAGEAKLFSLKLLTKTLRVPLFAGMNVVFFKSEEEEASEFDVQLEWQWPLGKHIRNFELQGFSYAPEAFIEVLMELAEINSREELFGKIVTAFLDDGDDKFLDLFDNLISAINTYDDSTSGVTAEITTITTNLTAIRDEINAQVNATNLFTVAALFERYKNSDSLMAAIDAIKTSLEILEEDYDISIDLNMEILHILVNLEPDVEEKFQRLITLFRSWMADIDKEDIKNFLVPQFGVELKNIRMGIEFPRKWIIPAIPDPENPGGYIEDPNVDHLAALEFTVGSVKYSTGKGLEFEEQYDFDFAPAFLGNTGIILEFEDLKVDFSDKYNIPEATADGRAEDFKGMYAASANVILPSKWFKEPDDTNATVFAKNLLVGTGGLSGTLGLEAHGGDDTLWVKLGSGSGFRLGFHKFDMKFRQNAIIESNIEGSMILPGFKNEDGSDAKIDVGVHIGQEGEFNVVASTIPAAKKIKVPGAFEFGIESLFVGREAGDDGRFYVGVSGKLDFTVNSAIAQYLPDAIDIEKMLIYDDGTFEFEGGKLTLPKAVTLSFGPAKLSITGIHMGAYERDGRKYKFFGFDGGVKVNPGGVDAHGKGIKYYYTVDDGDFDWFIGLESLTVDIIIPSGADPEKAAVAIRGFLSITEPKIDPNIDYDPDELEVLQNSQEYSGGVSVSIPKFKGLKGSAAMRLNPKVPSFIIDLGIELSTPIVLGATGLGIYGFRGLLGKKYVATKSAAGVPEDGEWWQYYKAKIDPDYRPGIQVSKFSIKNGFSFGAGVSLATASDSGKIFSSKLFFLLSLPDVFLFQGQAQFLKERIGLDTNPDPPFFAIIAITNKSIEAGFGVNYKLRDDGKIVTVDGIIELGFFWGDSSAWYINVGRETPEDRRIQARLFDILNMYFYLMLSSEGMRLGAGVKFELKKTFGPLSAELKAYIDTFGKISRRPKQIGGAIKMGGSVKLKVCGFGFGVSGGATLAAEAPKPHIVTGEFEVCVTVLKKERCARFEFTWSFSDEIDTSRVPLLVGTQGDSETLDTADVARVAGSVHMVSGERFPIASTLSDPIPAPSSWIETGGDDHRIPMDSFIDIEFKKGMNVSPSGSNNLGRIGGQSTPAKYVEFVPPIRGKSDRVRHEYYLKDLEIFYWNENTSTWQEYDFYEALRPIYENAEGSVATAISAAISEDILQNGKWGYWQQQLPGMNNKLRILATSPLSYTSSTGGGFNIEDMGINGSTIFCPGEEVLPTCVTFDVADLYTTYAENTLRTYENVIFRIVDGDGMVLNVPYEGLSNGLIIPFGCKAEIFFNEPMKVVNLLLSSSASQMVVNYYRRNMLDAVSGGLTSYDYELVHTETVDGDYEEGIAYTCADEGGIDHITIEPNTCSLPGLISVNVNQQAVLLNAIKNFYKALIENEHLTSSSVELFSANYLAYESFLESPLYGFPLKENNPVQLIQNYISGTSLSFRIVDAEGFDCLYTLELQSEFYKFDYSSIIGVKSVTLYTEDDEVGANNNFLITFDLDDNQTATFLGSTCKTLSYAYDRCATGFYKLCYLSLENYLANQSIVDPTEGELSNNDILVASINKMLYPVWRPNTTYAIRVTTEDKLYRESGATSLGSYNEKVTYGFKTAGPIGHFHQYPELGTGGAVVTDRQDYGALAAQGKADDFRLNNLRSYIDYSKSYPNADGQLTNAKPLFYHNAELRLFYLYNYVYQFYTDWVDYANTEEDVKIAESSLEVQIINPAPSESTDETGEGGFEANSIQRITVPGQPPVLINEVNHDVAILNNLLVNGNPCADHDPVAPIDISTVKTVDLQPNKLYNAQFVAHYKPRLGGDLTEEEFQAIVHRYVFQTSRYKDFAEQVGSYVLKADQEDPEEILRSAIYPLEVTKTFDTALAEKVVTDDLDFQEDILLTQYTDRFEQLVNGVLGIDLNVLQAAVRTEFNLVRKGENLLGILVRNPEPFNDPKIPVPEYAEVLTEADPLETLLVYKKVGTEWVLELDYIAIHSKDRSQIFVTNRDGSLTIDQESELKLQFIYKQYNGVEYVDFSTADAEINLTNYTI